MSCLSIYNFLPQRSTVATNVHYALNTTSNIGDITHCHHIGATLKT
jgi:hypothetical protein